SKGLGNLAGLLQNRPQRLPEAKRLAEEALAIDKTLDPGAVEIWITYQILAEIAQKQGESSQAMEYRRLAREAKWNYAGTRYELRKRGKLIGMVVAAVSDSEVRQQLEEFVSGLKGRLENLAVAIRQILAGERDEDAFLEDLHYDDAVIIRAILQGIANPETLQDLL
ncbi:MAG: hypothetical protein WA999_14705, partial [Spirulinaceae cyanobacterium]